MFDLSHTLHNFECLILCKIMSICLRVYIICMILHACLHASASLFACFHMLFSMPVCILPHAFLHACVHASVCLFAYSFACLFTCLLAHFCMLLFAGYHMIFQKICICLLFFNYPHSSACWFLCCPMLVGKLPHAGSHACLHVFASYITKIMYFLCTMSS